MSTSSERGWFGDFWGFFSAYARTGIHAATAVAVTVGFGLSSRAWWYAAAGVLIYVLPPIYLYATGHTPGSDRGTTTEPDPGTSADANHVEDRSASLETGASDDAKQAEDRSKSPNAGASDDAEHADDRSEPSSAAAIGERDGSEERDDEPEEWTEADTPIETALHDVALARTGPYAVGEDGVVLARRPGGWAAAIEQGPTANANSLRGIDATAEGAHVWFVGDSGVLGLYDTDAERLTDYSAPEDRTSTWEDIAVVGEAGSERLFLANGSGEIVRGENDDGSVAWDEGQKPGSGSSIAAIAFAGEYGVVCDTNQAVFETDDGGETYTQVGVEDANATFTDIAVVDPETVMVACDDGSVIRYDGERWTTRPVGEAALAAIDRTPDAGLAAGAGGSIHEHAGGGWNAVSTPTEADLMGIVVGSRGRTEHDAPDVAVGAEGTIVER